MKILTLNVDSTRLLAAYPIGKGGGLKILCIEMQAGSTPAAVITL
jgi:hypothetical protein